MCVRCLPKNTKVIKKREIIMINNNNNNKNKISLRRSNKIFFLTIRKKIINIISFFFSYSLYFISQSFYTKFKKKMKK